MTKGNPCGWQRETLVNSQRGTVAIGQESSLGFGRRFHHNQSLLVFSRRFCHKGSPLGLVVVLSQRVPIWVWSSFMSQRVPPWVWLSFPSQRVPPWFGCPFVTKGPPLGLAVLSDQGGTLVNGQGGILVNDQGGSLWTAKGDPCDQLMGDRCNRSRVLPWVWPSFSSQQVPPCI